MRFLINHGEKLLTFIVVAACLAWIVLTLEGRQDSAGAKLDELKTKIDEHVRNAPLPPAYPNNPATLPLFTKELSDSFAAPEREVPPQVPSVAYPRPKRPEVKEVVKPPEPDPLYAKLAGLRDFGVRAEAGAVVISASLPKVLTTLAEKNQDGLFLFTPVRVEFYRGTAADSVTERIGIWEISPEDGEATSAAATPPPTGPEPPHPAVPVKEFKTNRERLAWEEEMRKKGVAVGGPAPAPVGAPQPRPTNQVQFEDTKVKPRTPYFYAARLVVRAARTTPEGDLTLEGKTYRLVLPRKEAAVPSAKPGIKLYASPLTEIKSATALPSITIRYSGIFGQLPDPKALVPVKDYKGNFEISIWNAETKRWEKKRLAFSPGQRIAGKYTYTPEGAKRPKEADFETEYEFAEIQRATQTVVTRKTVAVEDPQTKKIITREQDVPFETLVEVAILKSLATRANEVYPLNYKPEAKYKLENPPEHWGIGTAITPPGRP